MNEIELRNAIKNAALVYRNAPYRHLGWGPDYFDCVGLVVRVGWDLDMMDTDIGSEFRSYGEAPKPAHMKAGLSKYLVKIPLSEAGVGDILWFRDKNRYTDTVALPMHLGIITRTGPQGTYVMHAYKPVPHKKVIEMKITGKLLQGAWRYRDLAAVMQPGANL
jgi:hypothetical protein